MKKYSEDRVEDIKEDFDIIPRFIIHECSLLEIRVYSNILYKARKMEWLNGEKQTGTKYIGYMNKQLCKELNVCETTITETIKSLCDKNILEVKMRRSKMNGRHTTYRLFKILVSAYGITVPKKRRKTTRSNSG